MTTIDSPATKSWSLRDAARDVAFITVGILSASMGIKGFLLSSHFIDGGVTGISMLLAQVLGWPIALLLLGINLPFVALQFISGVFVPYSELSPAVRVPSGGVPNGPSKRT